MSFPRLLSLMQRVSFLGFLAVLVTGFAVAQSSPSQSEQSSAGYSSSNNPTLVQIADSVAPEGMGALPSAPTPAASAAGQDSKRGWKQNLVSKYAIELGGGFDAPTDKTYITWGGLFTLGRRHQLFKAIRAASRVPVH